MMLTGNNRQFWNRQSKYVHLSRHDNEILETKKDILKMNHEHSLKIPGLKDKPRNCLTLRQNVVTFESLLQKFDSSKMIKLF